MNLSLLIIFLISCSSLTKIRSEESGESEFNNQLKKVKFFSIQKVFLIYKKYFY